eukprot:UN12926
MMGTREVHRHHIQAATTSDNSGCTYHCLLTRAYFTYIYSLTEAMIPRARYVAIFYLIEFQCLSMIEQKAFLA